MTATVLAELTYSDVPAYLHDSLFYRSLPDRDNFTVPSQCFKLHDAATSLEDFESLLYVTIYWGKDTFSEGVMSFCRANDSELWEACANIMLELCAHHA